MTSLEEQSWLREFAAERYEGIGAFVELGCLFGSLTLPIAEGLKSARERRGIGHRVVECFDLFYFHESMQPLIRNSPLEGVIKEKDWFFEVFKANTASVSDHIHAHWVDLAETVWKGGPIESLLLDCLKYDDITNQVIPAFLPSLIPGRSRLLHQDYFHFFEWWTHVLTFEQRHLIEPELEIPKSGMLVLRVTGDFTDYCAAYDCSRVFANTPIELVEEAYAWNLSIASDFNVPNLLAAKVWALLCLGVIEAANRLYVDAVSRYPAHAQFRMLKNYCDTLNIPLGAKKVTD